MPLPNQPTKAIAASTEALAAEAKGRENGMADRIAAVVDRYWLSIAAFVAKQPTYAEIIVAVTFAHQAMRDELQREFGKELDKLTEYVSRRAISNTVKALPDNWIEELIQTVRPEPLPVGISVEKAAKALVFRPDEARAPLTLAQVIRDSTRLGDPNAIAATINRVRTNGGTPGEVMKAIRPMVQGVKSTVHRVVRDSGQLATTLQNVSTWNQLGNLVVGLQVNAVPRSEFSRPDHLERSGTIYYYQPTGEQKSITEAPLPPYDRENGRYVLKHNCRCHLGRAKIHGAIRSITRAWYAGEFFELRTRRGALLTVTANHPVMTDQGFVPANQIRQGDYLISDGIRCSEGPDNVNDGIPSIEQVFKSFVMAFGSRRQKRPDPLEFHGDGRCMNQEIDIVGASGGLMDRGNTSLIQRAKKSKLVRGASLAVRRPDLHRPLGGRHLLPLDPFGVRSFAESNACFQKQSVNPAGAAHTFLGRIPASDAVLVGERLDGLSGQVLVNKARRRDSLPFRPPSNSRFTFSAERDVVFDEASPDGNVASVRLASELVDRYAREIAFDDVVSVKRFTSATHVYSVDSGLGYYMGSDSRVAVINGNCWLSPVLAGQSLGT